MLNWWQIGLVPNQSKIDFSWCKSIIYKLIVEPHPPPRALDFFIHFHHHQNNKHRAASQWAENGKISAMDNECVLINKTMILAFEISEARGMMGQTQFVGSGF